MTDSAVARVTMSEYLALKRFSSGMAQTIITQSPLHAWHDSTWNPSREDDRSEAADIGTLAHSCLLEGGTDNVRVFDPSDFPNKNGKGVATGWTNTAIRAARDAAIAEGEIPMLRENFDGVQAMVKAAQKFIASSELAGIFDAGEPEATLLFELNGIQCKARPDWLPANRRISLSYKTVGQSAAPAPWIRTAMPSLSIGTVFSEQAIQICFDVERHICVHLIQETYAPFACSLVALSPAYRDMATYQLDTAMATWKSCVAKNHFPAYQNRIHYAEPMPWQQVDAEEREADTLLTNDELKGGIPA